MYLNRSDLLDYDKWNRRLLNLHWVFNAVILMVEVAVAAIYHDTPHIPSPPVYIYRFIFIPSALIFLFTAGCELAVWLIKHKYANFIFLQPYIITFTCVAFCGVLLIVHYSVTIIFVVYIIPVFFSIVYNSRRVLTFTFLFSFLVFIVIYAVYFTRRDLPYMRVSVIDLPASIAILVVAYLIGRTILTRNEEVINILAKAEHIAYESKAARDRAEALAEARRMFLANMSHEIRTPMNGIIGLTELALGDAGLSPEQADYLHKINRSADGLLTIINDILDISKIDSGEATLEAIPFYLNAVLNECVVIVSQKARENGLELYYKDESNLESRIVGDPTKLRQALLNFLSNAVKFTGHGSVTLLSRLEATPPESGAVKIYFEVSDTGIGMTPEQLKHIFEPFNQADNSITRCFGGTGLGLAISKSIIEMMGGKIDVKSGPNIGSSFSFSLRFALFEENSAPLGDSGTEAERPFFKGDALLCEDDVINQQVAVQNLEMLGFNVVLAENGKSGVEEVLRREREGNPFDVIFMDIHMPVMDGLQAAKKLVEAGVKTPMIAMTADALSASEGRYMNAGMADYLRKPFRARELWACLMKHLAPSWTGQPEEAFETAYRHKNAPDAKSAERETDESCPIDEDLGTEHFAGSREAFLHALDLFPKTYAENPALIKNAVADGDFSRAIHLAHAEKGASAIIGATRLSALLAIAEKRLKAGDFLLHDDILDEYGREHERALNYISEVML